jgi:sugar diacid utilization regulator
MIVMAKVSKCLVKPYLRKNDHPFVTLTTFINYVSNNKNWSKEKIQSIVKEAKSKDRNHFYETLKSYMDED